MTEQAVAVIPVTVIFRLARLDMDSDVRVGAQYEIEVLSEILKKPLDK